MSALGPWLAGTKGVGAPRTECLLHLEIPLSAVTVPACYLIDVFAKTSTFKQHRQLTPNAIVGVQSQLAARTIDHDVIPALWSHGSLGSYKEEYVPYTPRKYCLRGQVV
jgi:hypothetical protein